MEHPLHTITYVADIEGVLVIMAHLGPALESNSACSTPDSVGISEATYTPKITCHVLDAENVSVCMLNWFPSLYLHLDHSCNKYCNFIGQQQVSKFS